MDCYNLQGHSSDSLYVYSDRINFDIYYETDYYYQQEHSSNPLYVYSNRMNLDG